MNLVIKKLKNFLSYTYVHYFFLQFTNPNYIKWLKKEYVFYRKFLSNENLIFDLGASRRDKAHIFLKFSKRVVAYEPEEKMNSILKSSRSIYFFLI